MKCRCDNPISEAAFIASVRYREPLCSECFIIAEGLKREDERRRNFMLRAARAGKFGSSRYGAIVVALRVVDGLTFEEIGEELGITRQRAHQLFLKYQEAGKRRAA